MTRLVTVEDFFWKNGLNAGKLPIRGKLAVNREDANDSSGSFCDCFLADSEAGSEILESEYSAIGIHVDDPFGAA